MHGWFRPCSRGSSVGLCSKYLTARVAQQKSTLVTSLRSPASDAAESHPCQRASCPYHQPLLRFRRRQSVLYRCSSSTARSLFGMPTRAPPRHICCRRLRPCQERKTRCRNTFQAHPRGRVAGCTLPTHFPLVPSPNTVHEACLYLLPCVGCMRHHAGSSGSPQNRCTAMQAY